ESLGRRGIRRGRGGVGVVPGAVAAGGALPERDLGVAPRPARGGARGPRERGGAGLELARPGARVGAARAPRLAGGLAANALPHRRARVRHAHLAQAAEAGGVRPVRPHAHARVQSTDAAAGLVTDADEPQETGPALPAGAGERER